MGKTSSSKADNSSKTKSSQKNSSKSSQKTKDNTTKSKKTKTAKGKSKETQKQPTKDLALPREYSKFEYPLALSVSAGELANCLSHEVQNHCDLLPLVLSSVTVSNRSIRNFVKSRTSEQINSLLNDKDLLMHLAEYLQAKGETYLSCLLKTYREGGLSTSPCIQYKLARTRKTKQKDRSSILDPDALETKEKVEPWCTMMIVVDPNLADNVELSRTNRTRKVEGEQLKEVQLTIYEGKTLVWNGKCSDKELLIKGQMSAHGGIFHPHASDVITVRKGKQTSVLRNRKKIDTKAEEDHAWCIRFSCTIMSVLTAPWRSLEELTQAELAALRKATVLQVSKGERVGTHYCKVDKSLKQGSPVTLFAAPLSASEAVKIKEAVKSGKDAHNLSGSPDAKRQKTEGVKDDDIENGETNVAFSASGEVKTKDGYFTANHPDQQLHELYFDFSADTALTERDEEALLLIKKILIDQFRQVTSAKHHGNWEPATNVKNFLKAHEKEALKEAKARAESANSSSSSTAKAMDVDDEALSKFKAEKPACILWVRLNMLSTLLSESIIFSGEVGSVSRFITLCM